MKTFKDQKRINAFIHACEEYSEQLETLKKKLENIQIALDDWNKLAKRQMTTVEVLTKIWHKRMLGTDNYHRPIPYALRDYFYEWFNDIDIKELYSYEQVYHCDIFSISNDGKPFVDMKKVENLAKKQYTIEYNDDIENRFNSLKKIVDGLNEISTNGIYLRNLYACLSYVDGKCVISDEFKTIQKLKERKV